MGNLIYHYTSPQALLGILDSESIWATHYAFLNDRKEMLEGCEYFMLQWRTAKEANSGADFALLANLDSRINELIADIKEFKRNIFIACFSKNPDSLYQWRSYCPPTGGFAIGINVKIPSSDCVTCNYEMDFKYRAYDHGINSNQIEFQGYESIYDPDKDHDPINIMAQPFFLSENLQNLIQGKKEAGDCTLEESFVSSVFSRKNIHFQEENEFRFVVEIKEFRTSDKVPPIINFNGIRPYIQIPVRISNIKEIVISPQGDREQLKLFLEMLPLRFPGLKLSIKESQIPYRAV